MSDDIQISQKGAWGVITLTREKALNALSIDMCAAIDKALSQWALDDAVKAVLVEGQGEKAFCAGGDIKWMYQVGREDPAAAAHFFRVEYQMNARIAAFPKPYVALMDGICMGGGVGISMNASHRIVTERTIWAMPECAIGLIPDVGATYMLPRLPGGLGRYLGLTGARLKGADCLSAEVASHFTQNQKLPALREALLALDLGSDPSGQISEAVASYHEGQPGDLIESLHLIDQLFDRKEDLPHLMERLRTDPSKLAEKALFALKTSSPTSLHLTHHMLSDPSPSFVETLAREFCVAAHLMEGPDFHEGVRAQMIDKDRLPQWSPSKINDV
ncbi:MAG: enoyl-CoA hydratase/isomerase family protein, partial [Pseudomonadota bacterium]